MQRNVYEQMARELHDFFNGRKVVIFPLEHGGVREAIRLEPYLQRQGNNNIMFFRRLGYRRPEESCLEQSVFYRFEFRPITTRRKVVRDFIRAEGETDAVVVMDSQIKSATAPSLIGGYVYFIENADYFGIRPESVYTAVFEDNTGTADISPLDGNVKIGTRQHVRQYCPETYWYLLRNGFIKPEEADRIFSALYESSGRWEKMRLYLTDTTERLVIPLLSRLSDYPLGKLPDWVVGRGETFKKSFVDDLGLKRPAGSVYEQQHISADTGARSAL